MLRGRQTLLFFVLVAGVLCYSFPHFEALRSANELPRVYLTWAMVEEGRFAIDTGAQRWGKTADVSPHGDHLYSNKAPGSSFLAVPGYLVLKAVKVGSEPTLAEMLWVSRFTTGILPTFVFLLALFRFLRRYAEDPAVRRVIVAAYGLGTMAMTYSVLFIAHQLSAICIFTAFMLAVGFVAGERPPWHMLLAGLAAGAAPLVDYQAAFAGLPIAIFVIAGIVRQRRSWLGVAWAAAGAAIPIAVLLFYHWKAFGSPWTTGYAASETFAHFHQKGFLGLDRFRMEALLGSMVSPDNGLLLFSPILLLAAPGLVLMLRNPRWRSHALVSAAVIAIYVAFISSLIFWRGGWQMGPRYITAMLPFAFLPIAVLAARVDNRWLLRGLVIGLALIGIVIYALSCAEYPHFPEKFKNPIYEVTFRLIGEGHAPYNLGWLLGLRGLPSLIPYFALIAGVIAMVAMPSRAHARSAAVGIVLATVVLVSYRAFPGGGDAADAAYDRWVAGVMPR